MDRFSLVPLAFFFGLFSAQTTWAAPSDFIVGGTVTPVHSFIAKSTVALVMVGPNKQVSLCSGSIWSDDMIVTAAHCVADNPAQVRIIFSGELSAETLKTAPVATGFLANPAYNPKKITPDQNDIAVVYFNGGLPAGTAVAKVLPQYDLLTQGETVELAGYGITDANTHAGAGILRQTEVKILNPALGKSEVVLDQTDGHGACHGDSGGPAFVQVGSTDYLWGVTSRGYPNRSPDDCAHDVVYTKVEAHLDFLAQAEKQPGR